MPFDAISSPPEAPSSPTGPAPAPEPWLDRAVSDLERVAASSSPALRRRVEAALARVAGMNGGRSLREALVRPASTPFVALVDACAADLGLAGDRRAGLLGRAMVLAYLYVRVQDDLVDEPDLVDRAAVYAAEAFLAEHLALFAEAVPSALAFAWRARLMRAFAEVAAEEVDDRARLAGEDGDLAWMGAKFLPMAVPLAGMAVAAGRPQVIEEIVAVVREIGVALQLVNDVLNVAEDAARARPTPVLRRLHAAGVDPAAPLRAALLAHPVLPETIAEARAHAEAAAARALAAGLPEVAGVAEHVRRMVERTPDALCRLMLAMPV